MATSAEARIKALLFARLGTLTGAGAALPVAWPNVGFTPPNDGKFLRADFIPGLVGRICIGSADDAPATRPAAGLGDVAAQQGHGRSDRYRR